MSRPRNLTTANRIVAYCEMVHQHIAHDFFSGSFRVYAAEIHRLWPEESIRYLQRLFKDLGIKGWTTLDKVVQAVTQYFGQTPDPSSEKCSWIAKALIKWREFRHSQRSHRIGVGNTYVQDSKGLNMLKKDYVQNRDKELLEAKKKEQAALAHKRFYGNLTKEQWNAQNQRALEAERLRKKNEEYTIQKLKRAAPIKPDTEGADRIRNRWASMKKELEERKAKDKIDMEAITSAHKKRNEEDPTNGANRFRATWARLRATLAQEVSSRSPRS